MEEENQVLEVILMRFIILSQLEEGILDTFIEFNSIRENESGRKIMSPRKTSSIFR